MNVAAPTLLADLDTLLNTESVNLNGDTVRDLARSADRSARDLIAERDEAVTKLRAIVACDLSTVRSDYNRRLLDAIADAHDLLAKLEGHS